MSMHCLLALFVLFAPLFLEAQTPCIEAQSLMGKPLAEATVFLRLPGLTNENYLFADETGTRYVLRIPGSGTDRFIDRNRELANSTAAFQAGFNPVAICHYNNGRQITKYIEGCTFYPFEEFYQPQMIEQVASLLKRIHASDVPFTNTIDLFERIDLLTAYLEEHQVPLSAEFYHLGQQLCTLKQELSLPCFAKKVPSHGDPVPSNFLSVAGSLVLLDWEYSGLSDPAWDLAFLSSIMNYSQEIEEQLISLYNDPDPFTMHAKIQLFKPIAEYWLALWGFLQTLTSSPPQQEFFRYFASARLGKACQLLQSKECRKAKIHLSILSCPLYEENGQQYLKFYVDPERPLICSLPQLSQEIGLTPIQFGLWICPYCGILNPIEKRCCISPNCKKP